MSKVLLCIGFLVFVDFVKSPNQFNFGPIGFPSFRTLYTDWS